MSEVAQRQDSLADQLTDLAAVADELGLGQAAILSRDSAAVCESKEQVRELVGVATSLGMYDAADFLKSLLEKC